MNAVSDMYAWNVLTEFIRQCVQAESHKSVGLYLEPGEVESSSIRRSRGLLVRALDGVG
ncbi:hypothetical protein [Oryza sativa Japonica Group]|uniref:Uncharacterized protein P0702H08.30 n=1 Tax=Oryza sativa subsp. japonica TaxID=39947 RepID=Q5JM39_ORYSJ|nr:hypothetical protein [Oryza sativa Japonica Group]